MGEAVSDTGEPDGPDEETDWSNAETLERQP